MGLFRRSPASKSECDEIGRLLQRYLDSELDVNRACTVLVHLEDCKRCGLEAASYREIKQSLRRTGRPDEQTANRLRKFAEGLTTSEHK
jgi:anti-sigma factor RsiW